MLLLAQARTVSKAQTGVGTQWSSGQLVSACRSRSHKPGASGRGRTLKQRAICMRMMPPSALLSATPSRCGCVAVKLRAFLSNGLNWSTTTGSSGCAASSACALTKSATKCTACVPAHSVQDVSALVCIKMLRGPSLTTWCRRQSRYPAVSAPTATPMLRIDTVGILQISIMASYANNSNSVYFPAKYDRCRVMQLSNLHAKHAEPYIRGCNLNIPNVTKV